MLLRADNSIPSLSPTVRILVTVACLALARHLPLGHLTCQHSCHTLNRPASISIAAAAELSDDPQAVVDLRLRMTWGGGNERAWQSVIRIDDGQLSDPVHLGREADDPGSILIDNGQIQIIQPSPSSFSGCDFTLRAHPQASLTLEFAPRTEPTALRKKTIAIRDLISGAQSLELDSQQNRCHLTRAPGDRLPVEFPRDSLVFSPGEEVRCQIRPQSLGLPAGTVVRGRVELSDVRGDYQSVPTEVEFKIDADGHSAAAQTVTFDLPETEGVYEIKISLFPKRITDNLPLPRPLPLNQRPLTQRSIQLVSIAKSPPAIDISPKKSAIAARSEKSSQEDASWQVLAEIDPAMIRLAHDDSTKWTDWIKKMPAWKLSSSFHRGPIDNHRAGHHEHGGRPLLTLAPSGWIAYPLPIETPQAPHVLEIEYPVDWPQSLGISILEPNAAGRVMPLGLDSGFDVPENESSTGPRWLKHRLVFWPRTKTPLVLITNRRPSSNAACGKITLRAGLEHLPAAHPTNSATATFTTRGSTNHPHSPAALPPLDQRQVAAFFDRPLFPKNFGAAEALDLDGTSTWDDWRTFYDGSRRLVEYLKYAGYNSAVISVACEGGTIYPSELLQPTPKYDTGIFFQAAKDPLRKDVVELLFRMFDREGLTLIPAMQFASPLPQLEQKRLAGESHAGWNWVNAHGQTWIEQQGTNRGLAPHYNVLHADVQQAMLEVVDELTTRYANHPSFGGLALQLTPDGFAQLPGAAWGFDDDTIQAFTRDTGIAIPAAAPGDSTPFTTRSRFLLGEGRARWLAWRADQLSSFYGQLAQHLLAKRTSARLYLATAELNTGSAAQQALRPALPKRPDYADYLLTLGLDPRRLEPHPNLVMLRSQRIGPISDLASQGTHLEWNRAAELDRLLTRHPLTGFSGSQFFHEAATLELPGFEQQSPFGLEQTRVWLAAHMPPADATNRQRFAHAIAASDAAILIDGGWLLPLGQEDATRALWSIYQQLPATGFETVVPRQASSGQPVVLRARRNAGITTIYAVNDSPWPVTLEVDLPVPVSVAARRLAPETPTKNNATEKLTSIAQGSQWRIQLAPYDLQALQIAAETTVLDWRATLPAEATRQLTRRLQELRVRMNEMQSPQPLNTLANPGFEETTREAVLRWLPARGSGIQIQTVAQEAHSGQHALYLRTDRDVAWIRSEPIPTPTTGRFAMWVWIKTKDSSRQPALRLAIEGRKDGQTYYRFATVGGGKSAPLNAQWTQYFLQVDDLPTSGLQDLRVGFDLMEAGEVWIDDVQLFDRFFYDNERDDLVKQIGQADFQLQQGRVADCERFMQSYWVRYLAQSAPPENRPGTSTVLAANPATRAPRSDHQANPRGPRSLALRSTLSKGIFSRSPASQSIADLAGSITGNRSSATDRSATDRSATDPAPSESGIAEAPGRQPSDQPRTARAPSAADTTENVSVEDSSNSSSPRTPSANNKDKGGEERGAEKTGWRDRVPSIWPKKTR